MAPIEPVKLPVTGKLFDSVVFESEKTVWNVSEPPVPPPEPTTTRIAALPNAAVVSCVQPVGADA